MKCVVFGGAGFLGEHLCKRLLENNQEVSVYERPSERLNELKKKYPPINYIEGNFIEEVFFDKIISSCDVVFHLISTTVPSNLDTLWEMNSNVIPTLRLLEACKGKKALKVIYFSSGGTVYGRPCTIPISETHGTNPICSYGIQKLTIEKYLQFYSELYGLNYTALRISNPYGEGQAPFKSQGVIANFLARALLKQPIEIWGDATIVRDYIYVDDVIQAVLKVLHYTGTEKIFNISSNLGVSLTDIISIIEQTVGNKLTIQYVSGRKQDVPVNILNNNKARNELKWEPNVELQEGIEKMKFSWDENAKQFLIKANIKM